MNLLSETGLRGFIEMSVERGKPLLGICLGMQLLFSESMENGRTEGFKFLPGRCEVFPGKAASGERYKVPHMGWNRLDFLKPEHFLLKSLSEDYVYFVHSYVVKAEEASDVLASSDYHVKVPAVVGRGTVVGTQFHPEKSGALGMAIFQNYCDWVESEAAK
jgi:glutamine amidotransferase